MNRSRVPIWLWCTAAGVTVLLHYAWEMGQSRLFAGMADMPLLRHALVCFVASLGDLLIAAAAYAATATAFRRPAWALRAGWRWPAALWITIGLAIAVALEWWALSTGRWSYASSMPRIRGIGLAPLLQWLVVPAVALATVRGLATRLRSLKGRQSASAVSVETTEASDPPKPT